MQNDMLQRLLALIGKTGDRIVVTDPAGEKPYVLMSLEHYEKLLGEGKASEVNTAKKGHRSPSGSVRRPSLRVAEDLDPPVDLGPAKKKREIPLWKPSAPSKDVKESKVAAETETESESEEQFYLEPLE